MEKNCFTKERSETRNKRNINFCREYQNINENGDKTVGVIQGTPLDILIDSGALNVSLISSDVLKHFSCRLRPTRCALKGISDREIIVNSYVTLIVEFRDIAVEVNLMVMPSECMTAPIIIGTDVLNREGITYIRTKDRQYLTRSSSKSTANGQVSTIRINDLSKINTLLEGEEVGRLMTVINEFSNSFITGTATSVVRTGKMQIRLTSETPVAYRPYKISYLEKLKVREIVRDLLTKGIIRESESAYSSPILLVKKKDGSDRMCVDYRALNRVTVKERYPLLLIDDHIDRLGASKFFTSLDMATGFHQIPIDEDSIPKIVFVTPEGHYEYLRMPYGLANASVIYQRIINNTLRHFIEAGEALVYIDDVLLMSATIDEGIKLLRRVLQTLVEAGFSINLQKCSFLTTVVEYLGRVVSQGQVRPSPNKIEALVNAPVPGSVKQVR